jgi:hypothetical protein
MSTEELLKKLEEDRDAYLATLQKVHEALAKNIISSKSPQALPTSPLSRSLGSDRISRLSLGESDRPLLGVSAPATFKSSFVSGETDDLSDDDEDLYVQDLLPATSFDDEHLRTRLKKYKWNEHSRQILESLVTKEGRLKHPHLFPSGKTFNEDGSHYSLYQVFDVGTDGAPLALHGQKVGPRLPKGQTMWNFIKEINTDASKRQAVGRITILREPSPTLFAAIHLTHDSIFDMDELFSHLVQQGTTAAYMTRAFSEDPRKQKSFIFSFEYFTIIGDECEPMTWQESDQERVRNPNHIPISRCSSIVALSLIGEPIRKLRNSARRAKTKYGYVYSPWSPWQVLNIQCYPDWKSNTDTHESSNHYVNGPEAFLTTLLTEYKDAQKRFEEISQRVTQLITPAADFMFNSELRDKLLFEDDEFTYSRRYFWAFQTLGSMNQSIKAMIDAYEDTFTAEVWDGRHKTLWPLAEENGRNAYWKKRMGSLKKDFEFEIDALKTIMEENDDRRKEIRNLRDNLFSGTSVLESRKSVQQTEITVQQGRNIKLLTLVNMFFLPLTFVTSIYGMTAMPVEPTFWRFGVTLATVCIPFFLLIGSMNTTVGMQFWQKRVSLAFKWLFTCFRWTSTKGDSIRKRTDSITSIGSEPPKLHQRSLSASEGIAEREGRIERVATMDIERVANGNGEVSPSPKRTISFGQALDMPQRVQNTPPGATTPISAPVVRPPLNREESARRESTIQVPYLPSIPVPEPVMTTATSYAQSNDASESTEMSDLPAPGSKAGAALQKNGLGIWDKLRASRRRNGGRDDGG